jgi:hypothetical protein
MTKFDIITLLQVSLAPAFMLVALGGLLNLYAIRLGRIVDRSRDLQKRFNETDGEEHEVVVAELNHLQERMKVVNSAIFFGVVSAILICILIGVLFLMGFLALEWTLVVSSLFIISMLTVVMSLIRFLQEVRIANRDIEIRDKYLK